jgi:hypothetical protein
MTEPDELLPEAEQLVDEFLSDKKWLHPPVKGDPSPESHTRYQARLAKARVRNAKNHKIRKAKKDEMRKAKELAERASTSH